MAIERFVVVPVKPLTNTVDFDKAVAPPNGGFVSMSGARAALQLIAKNLNCTTADLRICNAATRELVQ